MLAGAKRIDDFEFMADNFDSKSMLGLPSPSNNRHYKNIEVFTYFLYI